MNSAIRAAALSVYADILPGYTWDTRVGRFRNNDTGRYVGRQAILDLLEEQVNGGEGRMAALTEAYFDGDLSAAVYVEQMKTEARRLVLQSEALGAGGWDRLTAREYGRAGRELRDLYGRIDSTAADIALGALTLAQVLVRVAAYAGDARSHYWVAMRESRRRSSASVVIIERNVLSAGAQHCSDCIALADRGWQLDGVLPAPGQDRQCRGNCRCSLAWREVPANEVNAWLNTSR